MLEPTMQVWTDAWHHANPETFKNVYSEDALIFPPQKPMVRGNENILQFMKGGLGKVDVIFERGDLKISGHIAFEFGTFKDVSIIDQKVLGEGQYAVTWILENAVWKVHCHTWSMPITV